MADSRFSAGRGRGAAGRGRGFSSRGRDLSGRAAAGNVQGPGSRGGMRGGRGSGPWGGRDGQRAGNTRQRWRPSEKQKAFVGSANEGHGFTLWRKQKVQSNYKKLLRKQKKATVSTDTLYADHYPEHLKHLYLAEEEKLRNEELKRRRNLEDQSSQSEEETEETTVQPGRPEELSEGSVFGTSLIVKQTNHSEKQSAESSLHPDHEQSQEIPKGSTLKTPLSVGEDANRVEEKPNERQKISRKTSYQKAREEYERVQLERAKKRQEAEENRKKREEAKILYKKKKMETYKMLSKKTKKGQPNFNVQMEYLLKKIQNKS